MMHEPPKEAVVVQEKIVGRGINHRGQSEIRSAGGCAWISLSQGLWAVIDAADIEVISGMSWNAIKGKNGNFYAGHAAPVLLMHRKILGLASGAICDHRDGDGLNNRRENLRRCTIAENNRNTKRRSNNKSGYKGVSFNNEKKRWQAFITVERKCRFLGYFADPELAHAAYAHAAYETHGEFARTN